MRAGKRLRRLAAHLRQVATDERLRSASVAHGRLDYAGADIYLQLTSREEFHRLRSCEKEPWTVRWIEQSLKSGEVLYDIGANIGVYTLLAAVAVPGSRVVAFEPAPANYAALCANAELNSVSERVVAIAVALGDRPRIAPLGRDASVPGASVGLERGGREATASVLVDRLDDVLARFSLPPPDHLKLDVDGGELEVLAGAAGVLASSELKSIMVELDRDRGADVVGHLESHGYDLAERAAGSDRPRNAPTYGLFTRR